MLQSLDFREAVVYFNVYEDCQWCVPAGEFRSDYTLRNGVYRSNSPFPGVIIRPVIVLLCTPFRGKW